MYQSMQSYIYAYECQRKNKYFSNIKCGSQNLNISVTPKNTIHASCFKVVVSFCLLASTSLSLESRKDSNYVLTLW